MPLVPKTGIVFVQRETFVEEVTGPPSLELVNTETIVPVAGTGETALEATLYLVPEPTIVPFVRTETLSACCAAAPLACIVPNCKSAFVTANLTNCAFELPTPKAPTTLNKHARRMKVDVLW